VADERKVGLVIVAKDATKGAIKGVGVGLKTTARLVGKTSSAFGSMFKSVGVGFALWNQSLEVARKLWGGVQMLIHENVAAALQFRQAGDPMLKWFQDQRREMELTRARLGDALLPVIKGFKSAIDEVTGSLSEWFEANRKLIGSKVAEWAYKVGDTLISGVGRGVLLVTKATYGWRMAWGALRAMVEKFFGYVFTGLAKYYSFFAKITFFSDKASKIYANNAKTLQGLADTFTDSSGESADAVGALTAELEEQEAAIDRLEGKAHKVWKQGYVKAQEEVRKSTAGTNQTLEEQAAALEKVGDAAKSAAEKSKVATDSQLTGIELIAFATQRMAEKSAEGMELYRATMVSAAISIGDAWGTTFAARIAEADTLSATVAAANAAILSSTIDIVKRSIMAYAAEAAAKAFAAHQAVPFVGIALGTAAAATALGLVQAYASKFAAGGMVTGGMPGKDSVPAMLQPGERVLTVSEAKRYNRRESRGGGQMSVTVAPQLNLLDMPSRDQRQRLIESLSRDLEIAVRDGKLRMQGAY
jgi:uncharacterized protein YukE